MSLIWVIKLINTLQNKWVSGKKRITSKYPSLQAESHTILSCSKLCRKISMTTFSTGRRSTAQLRRTPEFVTGLPPSAHGSFNIITSVCNSVNLVLRAPVPSDCRKPHLPFPSHICSTSGERAQESGDRGSNPSSVAILFLSWGLRKVRRLD